MSIVGDNIKMLRGHLNLTQGEFGKLFNVKYGTIQSYEQDRGKPKAELAAAICEHFGITTHQLLKERLTPAQLVKGGKPSEQSITHAKLEAAQQRIKDLEKTIADKDKIIALLEKSGTKTAHK